MTNVDPENERLSSADIDALIPAVGPARVFFTHWGRLVF